MGNTTNNVIFNQLERAVEDDQNDQASYSGQALGEVLRLLTSNNRVPAGAGGNLSAYSGHATYGLAGAGGGGGVTISPGAMYRSAPPPATVGPKDSLARLSLLPSSAFIAIPVEPALRYVLIQARTSETIVQETRDILNPSSDTSSPSLIPKATIYSLELGLKEGTAAAIPNVDSGWVALYGAQVPAGGSPNSTDLIDLRRQAGDVAQGQEVGYTGAGAVEPRASRDTFLETDATLPYGGHPSTFRFGLRANIDGFDAFAVTEGDEVISLALLLSPATTPPANGWLFVYLTRSPITGCARVSRAYLGEQIASNCAIVISHVPPNSHGRNISQLVHATPFAGAISNPRHGVCVGVIRRAGGDYAPTYISRDGDVKYAAQTLATFAPLVANSGLYVRNEDIDLSSDIPNNALSANYIVALTQPDNALGATQASATIRWGVRESSGQSPASVQEPPLMCWFNLPSRLVDNVDAATHPMRVSVPPSSGELREIPISSSRQLYLTAYGQDFDLTPKVILQANGSAQWALYHTGFKF